MRAVQIPLDRIRDNPWQTRQGYDEEHVVKIALSVLRHGLQQLPAGRLVWVGDDGPVVQDVKESLLTDQEKIDSLFADTPGDGVQLAFGHNRRRALSKIEEWVEAGERPARPEEKGPQPIDRGDLPDEVVVGYVPMRLRQYSDEEMADLAWTENEDRQDLSPLEEAKAIEKRMEDFSLTQTDVAERLGMARSTVSNKLRLLKLPGEIVEKVENEGLSERAASALLPYYQLEEEQREALSNWDLERIEDQMEDHPENVTSSDVRGTIRRVLGGSPSIDDEPFDEDHDLAGDPRIDLEIGDVESGSCSRCPLAFEYDGQTRCPERTCLNTKRDAWIRYAAQEGADDLGVELAEDLQYSEYHGFDDDTVGSFHDHDVEALEHARETECENLELLCDKAHERYMSPEDVPARWICHHGEDGTCECVQRFKEEAQEETNREKERTERLKRHVAEQLRPYFDDVSTQVLAMTSSTSELRMAKEDGDSDRLSRDVLIDDAIGGFLTSVRHTIDYEKWSEFDVWVDVFGKFFNLLEIEDVDVSDPEAPPAVSELREQMQEAKREGSTSEKRGALKEVRSAIGRRQAYLETYEPDATELERLQGLHSAVDEALDAALPEDDTPTQDHDEDETASPGLNAWTVKHLLARDVNEEVAGAAPLSAYIVAWWVADGNRKETLAQGVRLRTGKSNIGVVYAGFREPLQEEMKAVKERVEQDRRVTAA